MKRIGTVLLAVLLVAVLAMGCAANTAPPQPAATPNDNGLMPIKVGASPTPHAEILSIVKDELAEMGFDLQIIEYTDYVQPNMALEAGELDANYFQHLPYLDDFNAKNHTHLSSVVALHYEPFGIYPGRTNSLEDLAEGAKVAIPNDSTNAARALLLLESAGLIKLRENAGLEAAVNDIENNPKKLQITEVSAAELAGTLPNVDIAVINGNYAIQAGMHVGTDAIAIETKDSLAAATYANVLVVRIADEKTSMTKALIEVLTSEAVREFIDSNYDGAVIASF